MAYLLKERTVPISVVCIRHSFLAIKLSEMSAVTTCLLRLSLVFLSPSERRLWNERSMADVPRMPLCDSGKGILPERGLLPCPPSQSSLSTAATLSV